MAESCFLTSELPFHLGAHAGERGASRNIGQDGCEARRPRHQAICRFGVWGAGCNGYKCVAWLQPLLYGLVLALPQSERHQTVCRLRVWGLGVEARTQGLNGYTYASWLQPLLSGVQARYTDCCLVRFSLCLGLIWSHLAGQDALVFA